MTDVVICIPTFRRPQSLRRLLDAVAALKTQASLTVLVADNDAEGRAGFDLAKAMAPDFPFPLEAVIAHQRGIAQVRNTLFHHALQTDARFIAMIDDDEWPRQDWIEQFLRAAEETGAGVLQGSILFDHPAQADLVRASGLTDMPQSTANLFVRRQIVEATPAPWFDPQFALSGGEDRDFFVRLSHAGVIFAWADGARIHAHVPETRTRLSWMLQRAYSSGSSDMRVLLKYRPSLGRRAAELAKIAAALLLSGPAALFLAASPNRRAIPLEKLFRAAGKLSAMFGGRYNEYSIVHGE